METTQTTETRIKCPKCGSAKTVKFGFTVPMHKGRRQRYHCNNCASVFYGEYQK